MQISGVDTNANASFPWAGNYVMWSAHLVSPGYTRRNQAERQEIMSYYVITRETLAHKSISDQFTTTTTVDEIINANALEVRWKAKSQY